MIDAITKKLRELGQNKIELSLLQSWTGSASYPEQAKLIGELVQGKIIEPIKASGKNGCNPPLYVKYRILHMKEDDSTLLEQLGAMHYWIDTEYLRKYPGRFRKFQELLFSLSEFLKSGQDTLSVPMSENERAYAIWGDEKVLDKRENITILRDCGVWERLNTYPTPEPFFDYRCTSVPCNVLVIENKDTWFTMRKLMMESGRTCFFSEPVDCLVYGEGNKITKSSASLEDYLDIGGKFSGNVWYWGDLDPEGIGFFLSASEINSRLSMKPFLPAYLNMLRLFEERLSEAHTDKQYHVRTNQKQPADTQRFYSFFPEDSAFRIRELLEKGCYIPQEILNYQIIKSFSRSE